MIRSWISSSRLATTRSMRLMAFGTARSTPKSQQQGNCQGSTIWFCRKAILRRRILGSLHWRSSIFEGLSPPRTKTIQKNRQQHLTPSIRLYRWLGHPLHPGQQLSLRQLQNEANLLGLRRPQQRNVANHHHQQASEEVLDLYLTRSLLVFLLSTPTGLGDFLPITYSLIFRFSS